MGAREELLTALDNTEGCMCKVCAPGAGERLLNAYRAEVLREAAEEIRREADDADIPGSPASPGMIRGMKWAADWIEDDPDTP